MQSLGQMKLFFIKFTPEVTITNIGNDLKIQIDMEKSAEPRLKGRFKEDGNYYSVFVAEQHPGMQTTQR